MRFCTRIILIQILYFFIQLVKEQKGRITELARSKQEQITEFKVN